MPPGVRSDWYRLKHCCRFQQYRSRKRSSPHWSAHGCTRNDANWSPGIEEKVIMRKLTLLVGVLILNLFSLVASISGQQPTRYSVLMMGKPAGIQTTTIKPEGVREFSFEFNDRGRGPKLTSIIKLNAHGIPISVANSGNDYLKAPVAENFSLADGLAHWKNNAEAGEKKLAAEAFYNSMNGVPEEEALLAAALLKSASKRLALLPEGEASIQRTGELTLNNGTKTQRLNSYEI